MTSNHSDQNDKINWDKYNQEEAGCLFNVAAAFMAFIAAALIFSVCCPPN